MKRNDAVFILLIGVSVALTGLIITDNVISSTSAPVKSTQPMAVDSATGATQELRAQLIGKGLPLHDGKYWKSIHE